MILSNTKYVAVALFAALLLANSVNAQRRVFTNDDMPSPPPAVAEPSPAASPAESAMASQPTPTADGSKAQPAAPPDEVARLQAMLDGIGQAADILQDKIGEGSADEVTLGGWNQMRDCLSGVMVEFRQFIAEAQAEADRTAAAPPESAPAQP